MNALKIAKLVVFTLSIFLVAGFCLIISKITDRQEKINFKNIANQTTLNETSVFLSEQENVKDIFSCSQYICITLQKENHPTQIIIISPETGKIFNKISFKTK